MPCPVCGKAEDKSYRPFCSRRCADVDLGRWLTESYRIPADTEDPGEDLGDDPEDTPPAKPH